MRSPGQFYVSFVGWTSRTRNSFFLFNASYLHDETFELQEIVLGLPRLAKTHAGEIISVAVSEVLEEFRQMMNSKFGYLTLDSAPNNDRAVEGLGSQLQWQDCASRRIRSFGHIIHLVAKALLFVSDANSLEDLDLYDFDEWTRKGLVGKLHNLVVWLHRSKSHGRITTLARLLPQEGLPRYTGCDS